MSSSTGTTPLAAERPGSAASSAPTSEGAKRVTASIRRGILLAGGSGTRLHPMTRAVSKQLLPVYDKPLVYYPLCTLMLCGIREILVITTPDDAPGFDRLLSDGAQWGLDLRYAVQPSPDGIAQALVIGGEFLRGNPSTLILGDNIFYGHGLASRLRRAAAEPEGATLFGYRVHDPERYGVAEFDDENRVIGLEEKPRRPRSHYAVTGLYFYDGHASELASDLKPSPRGELEVTDLNRAYLHRGAIRLEKLGRGDAWLDTGTPESMLEAANFIHTVEKRQGLKIACPEEVAYRMGFIDEAGLAATIDPIRHTDYGRYLEHILAGG